MGVSALFGQLLPYVIGLGAALLGLVGVYTKGRRDQKRKAEHKQAEDIIKTRKRTDEQDYIDPDINATRDRLRQRGQR